MPPLQCLIRQDFFIKDIFGIFHLIDTCPNHLKMAAMKQNKKFKKLPSDTQTEANFENEILTQIKCNDDLYRRIYELQRIIIKMIINKCIVRYLNNLKKSITRYSPLSSEYIYKL